MATSNTTQRFCRSRSTTHAGETLSFLVLSLPDGFVLQLRRPDRRPPVARPRPAQARDTLLAHPDGLPAHLERVLVSAVPTLDDSTRRRSVDRRPLHRRARPTPALHQRPSRDVVRRPNTRRKLQLLAQPTHRNHQGRRERAALRARAGLLVDDARRAQRANGAVGARDRGTTQQASRRRRHSVAPPFASSAVTRQRPLHARPRSAGGAAAAPRHPRSSSQRRAAAKEHASSKFLRPSSAAITR